MLDDIYMNSSLAAITNAESLEEKTKGAFFPKASD